MRALLRPVALAVAFVLAAVPAAALACQLTCATPDAAHHHHHGSHGDAASETTAVRAAHAACGHTGAIEPARIGSVPRVEALSAIPVAFCSVAPVLDAREVTASPLSHSPPGGRAAPVPLRI